MLKMDDFGENTKPIGNFFMLAAKMDDFGENTKPIALLFGEIFSFLDTFSL